MDEADFSLRGNTGLFLHAGLCSSPVFQGDFLRCGAQGGPGKGLTTALREMLCGGFGSVRDHS